MKNFTSLLLITVFAIGLTLAAAGQGQAHKAGEDPVAVGVYMYADWCGTCQAMDDTLMEAVRAFDGEPFLFARIDLTDDFTTHQSRLLASQLGLSNVFERFEGSTGFVALVDPETGEEIDRITGGQSKEEMQRTIEAALQ